MTTNFHADANFFLRFLLNDIPAQAKEAEEKLKNAKDEKITISVSQITIFEIAFILDKYYLLKKENVVEKIKLLLSTQYLNVQNRDELMEAISIFQKTKLDFVDCFIISISRSERAKILTFDKKLLNSV
jgi:predicted nucleic-acid-binding protein